jgi:hypothetical protein
MLQSSASPLREESQDGVGTT